MKLTRFVFTLSSCCLFLGCMFLSAVLSNLFAADFLYGGDLLNDLLSVPEMQRLPDEWHKDSDRMAYARAARLALAFPEGTPALAITQDYPRLDGATAFAHVYMAAAQAIYRDEPIEEKREPPTSPHERAAWMISQRDTPLGSSTRVYSTTTPVAYEQLIQGDMDMIFALTPSAKQQEKAAEAGLTLKLTPFAREAFVFVTSAENPVDRLSLAQIRAIYSGQITNWKEVGGADAPILAFQRQPGSARPLSENTQKLADWFLSDEGQRFVEKAGYAPIR